jgi:hypothetical protein
MRRHSRNWFAAFATCALVILSGWIVYCGLSKRTASVPAGSFLRFGDVDYTVIQAVQTDHMGALTPAEGTAYYLIKVMVANNATRVPFTFRPEEVIPGCQNGIVLQFSAAAQAQLAKGGSIQPSYTLRPGEAQPYDLIFVGPKEDGDMCVDFKFPGSILNALDNLRYGKRVFHVHTDHDFGGSLEEIRAILRLTEWMERRFSSELKR